MFGIRNVFVDYLLLITEYNDVFFAAEFFCSAFGYQLVPAFYTCDTWLALDDPLFHPGINIYPSNFFNMLKAINDLTNQWGQTPAERAVAYWVLFRGHMDDALLNKIRLTTNQGIELGNDRFRQEVEKLTGHRILSLKRGAKPRSNHKDENEFLL